MDTIEKLKKNGIYLDVSEVKQLCEKYKIIELAIFGSSIRDDFSKDSDVDFLVSFHKNAQLTLFDVMDAEEEFGQLLKREVQLVAKDGIKNSRRRERILSSSEVIYVASGI